MPDLWFWLVLGVVNAGLVWVVWREASRRGYDDGCAVGHARGREYERERNLNIAAATEADRLATIRRNRSNGARAAWQTRKSRGAE